MLSERNPYAATLGGAPVAASHLTTPIAIPGADDLRPLRQAKSITLTAAANQLGVWTITISELERGIRRNDELAQTYRDWLAAV